MGLACKAEAPLCNKGSTQRSGSQGVEYRNLDHHRAVVHVLVGYVASLVITHVVWCYRLTSCVSAARKRIAHLWVLAHVVVWFVVGYVHSRR